jgi:hypothetical protein
VYGAFAVLRRDAYVANPVAAIIFALAAEFPAVEFRRFCVAQKQAPALGGGLGIKALAMTYSRMRMHTTIGAAAFHFRVRDGIGWFHSAMFTRERVEGRGQSAFGRAVALTLS